jgi:hypothetical protein
VTLSNNLTEIAEAAFMYTALTSITIPSSVTNVCDAAFRSCESLTNVYFAGLTTITESSYTAYDYDWGTYYSGESLCSFYGDTVTLHYPADDADCAAYIAEASKTHENCGYSNQVDCHITWKQDYSGVTPGDINGDNKVDTNDLVRLMKKISENAQNTSLDINGDGKVDTNDLIRLMKYLTDNTVEIH